MDDPTHREEGGTPSIVGAIRAGMVFQLKEAVGYANIRAKEEHFIKRAIASWSQNPNIQILGNPDAWRLSIVSFIIRCGEKSLHHNFVVALLNDLFGIQARGGCSCAGPYGHRLLNIDLTTSHMFEQEVMKGCEGINGVGRALTDILFQKMSFLIFLRRFIWLRMKDINSFPCISSVQ